jgi:hypothetical protein
MLCLVGVISDLSYNGLARVPGFAQGVDIRLGGNVNVLRALHMFRFSLFLLFSSFGFRTDKILQHSSVCVVCVVMSVGFIFLMCY